MANDKYYGYSPKKDDVKVGWEDSTNRYGNRLDRVNPYEFRRGMDYELTDLGVSRLQESTPEEREKATESVLKNLEQHPQYYTALIQFESKQGFAGKITETSFNSYLKAFENFHMKEIKNAFKFVKMKDADFKGDKMEKLKESIKKQIKKELNLKELSLNEESKLRKWFFKHFPGGLFGCKGPWWDNCNTGKERPGEDPVGVKGARKGGSPMDPEAFRAFINKTWSDDLGPVPKNMKDLASYMEEMGKERMFEGKKDDEDDEDTTDKKATKGAKKGASKLSKFDKEREAIEKHLEILKDKKDKELEKFKNSKKDQKAIEIYKKAIELSDGDKKKLEKTAEKFDVPSKDYVGKDIPSTIKDLEKRLKAVDKDEEAAVAKLREDKKDIALTDMTREEQLRLLNIISEKGVSLREGSQNIKVYYEIAKSEFLEGLAKGLKI